MKALLRKGTSDRWMNLLRIPNSDNFFSFTDDKPYIIIDDDEYKKIVDKLLDYCKRDLEEFDLIDIEIKQL